MEKVFLESGVLGACVVAGGGFIVWLVKYMLEENKRREERHSQEIISMQEKNTDTIIKLQDSYKEELNKTQDIFIASMEKVVTRVDNLDRKVEDVENVVNKIGGTVQNIETMLK